MSDITYHDMTVEHLGDATEDDLRQFREACAAVEEILDDALAATDYVWNDGVIRFDAGEEIGRYVIPGLELLRVTAQRDALLEACYSVLNVEGAALAGVTHLAAYEGLDVKYHFDKVRAAIANGKDGRNE
jgi:hypothetical protein